MPRTLPGLIAAAVVLFAATEAFPHGGMWRGPQGIPPSSRFPTDPYPPPTGPVATPQPTNPNTPTLPGGPVEVPGGTPNTPMGPVATPGAVGYPGAPRPRGTVPATRVRTGDGLGVTYAGDVAGSLVWSSGWHLFVSGASRTSITADVAGRDRRARFTIDRTVRQAVAPGP